MKVIDILEIVNENTCVHIVENEKVVSTYDGKNSIDKKYNDMPVKKIDSILFTILIYI